MKNKYNVNPCSTEWLSDENCYVSGYFNGLGIPTLKDVLGMRVFDLMNMNRLDPIRVEEVLTCLYKYLNPNTDVDEAMYFGFMPQSFDYTAWRKKHKDLSKVTVEDLVLENGINLRAIQHFYDAIRKKYFHSDEYNRYEYRFLSWKEYLACREKWGHEQ